MDILKVCIFVAPIIAVVLLVLSENIESTAYNVTPAPTITDLFDTEAQACQTQPEKEEIILQNKEKNTLNVDESVLVEGSIHSIDQTTLQKSHEYHKESIKNSNNKTMLNNSTYKTFPKNIAAFQQNNFQTLYDWRLVFLNRPRTFSYYREFPIDFNGTKVVENETKTEGVKSEDETLPAHDIFESFEEWKKNKLVEAETKKSEEISQELDEARPTLRKQHKLVNYASQDCGAKTLDHNKEAKHVFAILDENKDLYMLNPCSSDIWFVIELCEPIQVKTIHLSNLELFSSSPNEFTISVSERYPTREWKQLDKFTAKNQRNLQVFNHEGENEMFAKYIKFQMLSHFGNEHFCPVTMVRVFGISMVEVYETHENQKEEEDLRKEQPETEQEEGTFDTVINIVKTAIGIDRAVKKDEIKSDEETEMSNEENTNETENNEDESISWQSSVELVENVTSESLIVLVKTGNGEAVENESRYHSIPLCSSSFIKHVSPIAKTVNLHMCWFIEFVCKISLASCLLPVNTNGTEYRSLAEYFNFKNPKHNDTANQSADQQVVKNNIEQKVQNTHLLNDELKLLVDSNVDSPHNRKQQNDKTTDNSPAEDNIQSRPTNDVKVNLSDNNSSTSTSSEKGELVSTGKSEDVISNNMAHVQPEKNQSSAEPLVINPGSNQKESVFMRLSNRIRILEQNMTLSSDYLENLSQRYKKQVDELQKAFNSTVNKLIETSKTADENDKKQTELIHLAEKELQKVSQELEDLATSGEALNRHLIERHLLLILLEIVVFISILFVFIKKHNRKVNADMTKVEMKMKLLEEMLKKYKCSLEQKEHKNVPPNHKSSTKKKSPKNRRLNEDVDSKLNNINPPETLFTNDVYKICSTNAANFKQGDFGYDDNPGLISDRTKEWAACNDKLHKSRK